MRRRNWTIVTAIIGATLALGVSAASSAGPGSVVKVKSTIKLGAAGYKGTVTADNPNCVAERTVVLKQQGNGVLSRVKTNAKGSWIADLEDLNANIKIPAKVFAVLKPGTQATAGPIYKCLGATSKVVTINGG